MAMAEAHVKRWGNSLGFIIPSDIVRYENITEGDIIKVDLIKEKIKSGFGILKGARPFEEDIEEHEDLW